MTGFTRCIVHAGTHKTGTTTVQDVLAAHRPELAAAGIDYPAMDRGGRDHNPLVHRLAVCGDDELAALPAQFGLSARPGGPSTLLLSAEELSTRIARAEPWAGFDDGHYWQHRRRFLTRLRQLLPATARVEVYLCFRDHESYAHSLYATKMLSGKVDWSFAEFVRRCAPIFDYRRQAEVLGETLGALHLCSFDALRGDLANRSFEWLGLPLRVTRTPRLNPTPTLDLIHWLARAVASGQARDDRECRADFCRRYPVAPDDPRPAVSNLWTSAQQRHDFLQQCHAPPLPDWRAPQGQGAVVDAAVAQRRADELEVQYQAWRRRHGGHRKHWIYFWRRW